MVDPHASLGDKAKAAGVFGFVAASDLVTIGSLLGMQPEVGAEVRATQEAVLAAADLEHVAVASDATTLASDGALACGESFAPDTRVATPHGERAIASLTVGDHVTAYDPATGKPTTQTVERVFINHDTDRLDVTLVDAPAGTAVAPAGRTAAYASHRRAPPATTAAVSATEPSEVIHTTASHPWLTGDHGWLRAGKLHIGEPVRLLDGGVATVVALHALPGVGPMWDLSLDATHSFAVGDAQVVVHNCPIDGGGDLPTSETWNSNRPSTLAKHFAKHGADFDTTSVDDYANQASKFLQSPQEQGLETLVTNDGSLMTYDPTSNTFGAYNADGTTQTFFKPTRGAEYWADQHGLSGAHPVYLFP